MHETLAQLHAELDAELNGLDTSQTQLRPVGREDAWTVQQIVEHLMLSYESTAKTMEFRLSRGASTKANVTPQNRAAQFTVTTLGFFPSGHKAPEIVQPGVSKTIQKGRELETAYAASLRTMDDRLDEVERAMGTGRCVTHAVLGPMSIAQWRRFHRAHGRHHLKQIRNILQGRRAQLGTEAIHG
jgi:hypothetical protein